MSLSEEHRDAATASVPFTIIEPKRGLRGLFPPDLWEYRDLFVLLTLRDLRVRYKQTAFGALWAVFQPVLLMVVFSVFLGRLADVPSSGLPYTLFAFSGLVPWTYFAQSLSSSASSLVDNERLVTKVYFPRLLLPTSSSASYLLDLAIGQVLVLGMVLYHDLPIRAAVLVIPIAGLLLYVISLSVSIGLAALNVRYRDVRYAIPFAIQVLLFLTPVVYPAELVRGTWRLFYAANPLVGFLAVYRWAVLGTDLPAASTLAVSFVAMLVLLCASLYYFRRVERSFADVI